MKTVLGILAGLTAGFAVAYWIGSGQAEQPDAFDSSPSTGDLDAVAATSAGLPARIEQLQSALDSEIEQRAALEQHVAELGAALEALRGGDARTASNGRGAAEAPTARDDSAPGADGPQGRFGRGGFRGPETGEQRIVRLVEAGFAPDRAAWIDRRTSELTMQSIQAQYQRRRGETVEPAQLQGGDQTLRQELGEADYERYLTALGRPTKVGVFNVIASSPAEQAGLRSGDAILSYGGTRVFDMRELNDLTIEGAPGQPVVLEVERDGQSVQIVLPRGPIGIGGGPFNRRQP